MFFPFDLREFRGVVKPMALGGLRRCWRDSIIDRVIGPRWCSRSAWGTVQPGQVLSGLRVRRAAGPVGAGRRPCALLAGFRGLGHPLQRRLKRGVAPDGPPDGAQAVGIVLRGLGIGGTWCSSSRTGTSHLRPVCMASHACQPSGSMSEYPCAIARNPQLASDRTRQDAVDIEKIKAVHGKSRGRYGARKIWHQLRRDEHDIARCTVERLMHLHGLQGVVRGQKKTTIPDPAQPCPDDKVNRQFVAAMPDQLWVSDFTYVSTWAGMVYVAFIIDVFARKIVGWRVSTSMTTGFVLDALNQAICQRCPTGGGFQLSRALRPLDCRASAVYTFSHILSWVDAAGRMADIRDDHRRQ
ncbi:IS3 family transposase [Pukyongiella litopenaei]|uniref:IS3 family transposase n=1 Tax=Pukyongiella litopenaei TaxID=2605946 RepID=A0A2S0ML84_9RHOB|nr:IS3 family transposase [Pukyongiella litopenaei]